MRVGFSKAQEVILNQFRVLKSYSVYQLPRVDHGTQSSCGKKQQIKLSTSKADMPSYGSHIPGPAPTTKSESVESLRAYDATKDMEQYWRYHLRRIYREERIATHTGRMAAGSNTSTSSTLAEDEGDSSTSHPDLSRQDSDMVFVRQQKSPSMCKTIFAGSCLYIKHKISRSAKSLSTSIVTRK